MKPNYYREREKDFEKVDHSVETLRCFGENKIGLTVGIFLALIMDAVAAGLLWFVTNRVKFFLAPLGLAILDLLFFVDVFFINVKQRYARAHKVIFIVFSVVLIVVSLVSPFVNTKYQSMTLIAVLVFLFLQAIKLFLLLGGLYPLGKRASFSPANGVLIALLVVVAAVYLYGNVVYGFMGQGVSALDKNCTLVYSLNERGEYVVVDSFHDGNVINVPTTFNGKKVAAIDCAFLDASVKKINIESDFLLFVNTQDLGELHEDLTLSVTKKGIDKIRLGLFSCIWTEKGEPAGAKTLFDSVVPSDLKTGEKYYNVSYTNALTSETFGYLPTIFKNDGASVVLEDLKRLLPEEKRQLLERTNVNDQGDLKFCFENNNKTILAKSGATDNGFYLTLERVYKFMLGKGGSPNGNDKKWIVDPVDREHFAATSTLSAYYESLPTRNGFSVEWDLAAAGAGSGEVVADAADFALKVSSNEGLHLFDLNPNWTVLPPSAELLASDEVTIVYGEKADFSIHTDCFFQVRYTLTNAKGQTVHIDQVAAGNWNCSIADQLPKDSGLYTLTMVASPDPEITTRPPSEPIRQDYTVTINKKALRLNWTLPGGEFTNADQAVEVAFEAQDKVGSDVITVTPDRLSAKDAGNYRVTASMDDASTEKYIFLSEGNNASTRTFTIDKKSIVVEWEGEENYVYNGKAQTPKAKTTVFEVTEYLVVTEGMVNVGAYVATASATEAEENDNGVFVTPSNYVIAQNENRDYAIKPLQITVYDWTAHLFTYNGETHTTTLTDIAGYVEGEEEIVVNDLVYDSNVCIDAGDYVATVHFNENSNYTFGEGEAATLQRAMHVEPAIVTYQWGTTVFNYNKGEQHPIATAEAESLFVKDEVKDLCEFVYDGAATDAGDYEATLVGVTNPNYKLSEDEHKIAYTINKIYRSDLALTYADRVYGDAAPDPLLVGNEEEGAITYLYGEDESSLSAVVPTAAGYYMIQVTTAETANYLQTVTDCSYVIEKRKIQVGWDEIDLVYSKTEKVPTPSVQNLVGEDVVNLTSGLMLGQDNVNVGTFTYRVTALDNPNYTLDGASGLVSGGYTITPFEVELEWEVISAGDLIYSKTAKEPSATAVNLFAGDVCSVSTALNAGDNVNVGTFTFRAIALDNANYKLGATPVSGTYTITTKAVTVTVNDSEIIYGAAKPAFSLNTSALFAGDVLTGSAVYTTAYDTNDPDNRGVDTYNVTVSGPANANYAITFEKGVLTVSQSPVTGSWNATSYVYDKTEHLPSATVSNKAYGTDEVTFSYDSDATKIDVGNYERIVTGLSGAAASNYMLSGGSNLSLEWKITPKAVTVKVNDEEITYGDAKPAFSLDTSALCVGDGLSGVSTYTTAYDVSDASNRSAKNYDVTVSGVSNGNYAITFAKGTLSVRKKPVVLVWDQNSYEYDKTAHLPVATVDNKAYPADVVTPNYNTNATKVNVGNYTRTVTGFGGAQGGNYTVTGGTNLSFNWAITTKAVTVTVNDSEIIYGAAKPAFSLNTSALFAGDVLTGSAVYTTAYDTSDPANRGVDTYEVTVSGVSNGNYAITFEKGTLTVTARPVSFAWDKASYVYDKTEHLPVATVSNKAYAADVVNVSTYSVDTTQTDVGNYTRSVTAISGANASNYTMTGAVNVTLNWSITPKAVTVKVNDEEITYGDAKPAFSLDTSALYTGDVLSGTAVYTTAYDVSDASKRSAKNYDVTVSGASNGNYEINFVKGTLTVKQKPVVLAWDQNSYEYDKTAHLPVATVDNKAYPADVVTPNYNTNATQVNVGNYTRNVTSLGGAQGGNYTVTGGTNLSLNWAITTKAVTVTVNDSEIVYGAAKPAFSLDTSAMYAGDVLTGSAIYATAYDTNDPANRGVKTYNVTVSGVSNGNYAITFEKGTLTVTARPVSFAWDKASYVYDKAEHLPVATVSNKAYAADVVNVSTYNVDTAQTDVGNYIRSVTAISGANASNYTMTGAVNDTLHWLITPKAATVTVNDAEIEYGSSKPAFTYNVSGLITGDELSGDVTYSTEYNNADAKYRSAGDYDVTVSGLSNGNYDVTFAKGTLSVRKKAVVLVWDQNSYEYDKAEHLPVATLDNKGFGSDNVTLIYNTNVAQVNVGNYTRTVTGFGGAQGGNYTVTGGSNLSLNWTITPKEVGLDWQVLSASQLVYTGTAKTVTATATGLEAGDVCSVTTVLNTGDNVNVGNFTFKATALGNSNYKLPAGVVSGSYAITKASRAAVVVEIEGWEVGDSANDPQVVSEIEESDSTTVTYYYGVQGSADEPTVTVPTEAGDYYVIAVLSASDNYFGATSEPCQFSIE